ncbi:hypothetical protein CDL15_Pgr011970 [Punica granatum]|uniref:Myb/SANT-like domain-containing protein n=1 Tax=Punica granatum TaxID=22663 RepID=A0A218WCB5_PUNGR|nr:hypothetical protein CDL15_Pgr011970 [Punica granatum]
MNALFAEGCSSVKATLCKFGAKNSEKHKLFRSDSRRTSSLSPAARDSRLSSLSRAPPVRWSPSGLGFKKPRKLLFWRGIDSEQDLLGHLVPLPCYRENIIIDWSDEMEFAFINIMLEKLRRAHSTTWKKTTWKEITAEMVNLFPEQQLCLQKVKDKHQRMKTNFTRFSEIVRHTGVGWDADTNTITVDQDVWDMFAKKNRAYKAFRSKGCNHYDLQKQLFSSSMATGALRISSTDPPPTESYTKPQPQNTPPSAKRSKSVTSPKKPEKNSIEEALEELAKLKSTIPHSLYVKAANALLDPGARRLFMWFKEDDRHEWINRQEWIMQLPHT